MGLFRMRGNRNDGQCRREEVNGGQALREERREVRKEEGGGGTSKLQGRSGDGNYAVGIPEPPPHTQIPSKRSHRPIA